MHKLRHKFVSELLHYVEFLVAFGWRNLRQKVDVQKLFTRPDDASSGSRTCDSGTLVEKVIINFELVVILWISFLLFPRSDGPDGRSERICMGYKLWSIKGMS